MTGASVRTLDAAAVRGWMLRAAERLEEARAEIDGLNVFPVADADTGTNLALTVGAVARALPAAADMTTTTRTIATEVLRAARGSSGAIVGQLLRGVCAELADADTATAAHLRAGLAQGADWAYAAVADPVEGTVLTVARDAAKAAAEVTGADVAAVAVAAADAAARALLATPSQLPALGRAGVVDAGGRGLVVILDALVEVLTGARSVGPTTESAVIARAADCAEQGGSFAYEVQYLLEADDAAIPELRNALAAIGDTVVVIGGAGLHNVHVHVDDVGAAVELGMAAGRPRDLRVTSFADQVGARGGPVVFSLAPPELGELFGAAGAHVITASDGDDVSVDEVLAALRRADRRAVVLPNSSAARPAVDLAAKLARAEGLDVTVVPTQSPLQGLAALAVHDPDRRHDDDVVAMTSAAGATRYAEISRAATAALTTVGRCEAGDVLGIIGGDVAVIGADVFDVACSTLDRMLHSGGELVTLLIGADALPSLGDDIAAHLRATHPEIDTVVHHPAASSILLLLGVE